MLFKRRRALPEVDNDIMYCASVAANEFDFLEWRNLVVHAAQRALATIKGDAALRDSSFQTMSGKLFLAERPGKVAPEVFVSFRLDNKSAWQIYRLKYHGQNRFGALSLLPASKLGCRRSNCRLRLRPP